MIYPHIPGSRLHQERSRKIALRFAQYLLDHKMIRPSDGEDAEWIQSINDSSMTMKLLIGYLSHTIQDPSEKEVFEKEILLELADEWIAFFENNEEKNETDIETVIRDRLLY